MTTIFDTYNFARGLTDKAGRGFLSPEEFSQWAGAAQMAMFNEGRVMGVMDHKTQTMLAPFAKSAAFTASSVGVVSRPSDYVQALRIEGSAGHEYRPVLFSELYDAIRSVLEPIEEHPRYTETESGFILYPSVAATGTITYYRLPTQPVVGYNTATYASTGEVVYDAGTSVQLGIPKAYWPELIKRTLAYIGVNLSDADLFAFSQTPTA